MVIVIVPNVILDISIVFAILIVLIMIEEIFFHA